jgi:hypothetical protein
MFVLSALKTVLGLSLVLALSGLPVWAGDKGEDTDGDGLSDWEEGRVYRTDSQLPDTDTDGLDDGLEVLEYFTLPLVADTDGDGYLDGIEVRLKTDPLDEDSRPSSPDLDGDGISNEDEQRHGSDPQRRDSDFDGLSDGEEITQWFTSPVLLDTDGDGAWDGEEVSAGSDPSDADSRPPKAQPHAVSPQNPSLKSHR